MPIRFFTLTALTVVLLATQTYAFEKASKARQEEVAKRGAQVIPFSLARTLHIFMMTKSGGIQQVVAKDQSDTHQIMLVREHLNRISKEFAQGNFSAPASIHGSDMPGLAELEKSNPGQIKIEYKEIPDGTQIEYSSGNPELIDAIRRWFDAQLADHAGALPSLQEHNKR